VGKKKNNHPPEKQRLELGQIILQPAQRHRIPRIFSRMTIITPNSITALIQVGALFIACISVFFYFRSFSKHIRLEENQPPPSLEEIEAIRLSKELDGIPIKRNEFEQRIRITRSVLVLVAAFALSVSFTEVAFKVADENKSWKVVLSSEAMWPMLSGSFLWVSTHLCPNCSSFSSSNSQYFLFSPDHDSIPRL
jgi:hypothetical protein